MSTRDGLIYGLDEQEYHSGPELSSTGMKALLDSPARFRHEREHRTHKKAFDVGHAIHARVLGTGLDVVPIPAELLSSTGAANTKAAKEFIAAAREAGQVPMKAADLAQAKAAADAVLAHPDARALFEAPGAAEVSAFAEIAGVPVRGRFDYLHDAPVIVDLKSSRTADPRRLPRLFADYRYELQTATYRRLLNIVRGDEDPVFIHCFVETEPPHLVSVVRLDEHALAVGDASLDTALALYRDCAETNTWPGYQPGVHPISLPRWHQPTDLEELL